MVRLARQGDTIHLHIVGPKSLLSEPVVVEAKITSTWYEVLNDKLKLNLTPEQGVFLCTMAYTPTAPRDGGGWRNGWKADLNEKVSEFISKFERKKKQYTVRLCDPNILSTFMREDAPRTLNNSRLRRTATPGSGGQRGRRRRVGAGRRSSLQSSPRAVGVGPQIVIPTQGTSSGGGGGHGLVTTNGGVPVVADYSRPRYVHTAHANRNQQQVYSTRLKRQLEETRKVGQVNGHGHHQQQVAQKTPLKRPRVVNGVGSSQVTTQRQPQVGQQQQRTLNVRTITSVVKLDPEGVESTTVEEFWDESELEETRFEEDRYQVGGQENGGGDEGEEVQGNGQQNGDGWQDEDDEDFDAASLCTAATQEEQELRREGIQVENLKALAEARMGRFSNAFMLRVKNEIRKLKRNNLWDRNVNRSPLACYLLQEIFKENM